MDNILLAHDRAIARFYLQRLVARPIDALSVLAMGLLARSALSSLPELYRLAIISGLITLVASCVYLLLRSRIAHFRSVSVLAAAALDIRCARGYMIALNLAASIIFTLVLFLPDAAAMALSLASWWVGIALMALIAGAVDFLWARSGLRAQERLQQIMASRYKGVYLFVVTAASCLVITGACWLLDTTSASAIAAMISLAAGLWYAPVSYSVVDFERLIGRSPFDTIRGRLRNLVILNAAFAAAAMLGLNMHVIALIIALFLVLICYKILEILLVRALGRHRTQFALVICLFAVLSAAMVQPLAIAIIMPLLGYWLIRIGNNRSWKLP